jgi:hypothetical protein
MHIRIQFYQNHSNADSNRWGKRRIWQITGTQPKKLDKTLVWIWKVIFLSNKDTVNIEKNIEAAGNVGVNCHG